MNVFRTWPLEPPPMEHAWLLPISASARSQGTDKQHYMPVLDETSELLPAMCGRLFNPGFAKPDGSLQKCARCERRLK